jgi:hypothetical protein
MSFKRMENEISAQEQISSFSHFYFSEEQRISNENEIGNENEEEEEIPQVQEEKIEEGIEEILLRRSNRIPQASTRLRDFITYKIQYPIQDFISYENITPKYNAFLTSIEK